MSYAVAKPQASSPPGHDGPPSSATVYDFICLFTHDLRRKQKRWQDGKLKYHSFNKKVMVYDDRGHFVGDAHWDQEGDLAPGDELSLDRGMALVQVDECTGQKQQDLTDLLDKRAREVEKRRQIAAAKTRPTPRSSAASGPQPQQQRPHLPLSTLVQSPGRIGRAAIPAHSPFEARQQKLHQSQPPTTDTQPNVTERAPPAKKRRTSPSPPSQAGFARSLFGAALNLSSCPGPELIAARARVLRERMLSQTAASTPQEEEDQQPMQSSPLFVQDKEEETPARPPKEQRSTLQPVTRHPIASARSVMQETEEAGNRNVEVTLEEDDVEQQENASRKRRQERQSPERQAIVVDQSQEADLEEPVRAEQLSKMKKTKEMSKANVSQPSKNTVQETRKKKPAAPRRSPSPEPVIIGEPHELEEAPRQRKPKESRKAKEMEKLPEAPTREEIRPKEPRTTLRMRSRQKRGLLMMRRPSPPPPEPPAPAEDEIDDRVAKTPSPEPSPPQKVPSSSPNEVVIPSSAPPLESVTLPTPSVPANAQPESGSDDDLPVPSKRYTKRRTYSPLPEPEVDGEPTKKPQKRKATKRAVQEDESSEEEPKKQSQRRKATKRLIEEDEASEEESQPRKRRAAKRTTYSEEPESDVDQDEEEEIESKQQGPRIARLARKGIRSREIIGYVPQGIDTLIPGAFASGAFRLGGPPVPTVSNQAPDEAPAVRDEVPDKSPLSESQSRSANPLPIQAEVPVESSPVEQKPHISSPVAVDKPVPPQPEEPTVPADSPPEPTSKETVSIPEEPVEILPEPIHRRIITVEAPPAVVRSNSANNAIAPTTSEANDTKLEALSAPEIPIRAVPEKVNVPTLVHAASSESESKPNVLLAAPVAGAHALPLPEAASSGSEPVGKPRIVNPASRGKKAARREDAAGLAPQIIVPFEPVQRMISTRPAGAGGRARISTAGPSAIITGAPPPLPAAAVAPVVVKKTTSMPGFTAASGGTWSKHAHDLLGMNRPERR